MLRKKLYYVSMCGLLSVVSVHTSANPVIITPQTVKKIINGVGAIGSLASFAYWYREFSKISDKAHDPDTLVIICRLIFDAFCAGAFLSNTHNPMINFFGLSGSVLSLVMWLPEILGELYEMNDPIYKNIYIARGVIDTFQAVAFYKKFIPKYLRRCLVHLV
jgi:hypothetical protein